MQAALLAVMQGDSESFDRQWEYATIAHQIYDRQQVRATVVGREGAERMRVMPRDLRLLADPVLAQLMSRLTIEQAETMYARAPEELKKLAYDRLQQLFRATLDEGNSQRSFDEVFPEPAGMAQFREAMRRSLQREQQAGDMGIERK